MCGQAGGLGGACGMRSCTTRWAAEAMTRQGRGDLAGRPHAPERCNTSWSSERAVHNRKDHAQEFRDVCDRRLSLGHGPYRYRRGLDAC